MRTISAVDPFTYAVHAFKELLLKNAGMGAIAFDLSFLLVFFVIMMTLATLLFKRSL
jgi:ABC-2 type transport system permease protein